MLNVSPLRRAAGSELWVIDPKDILLTGRSVAGARKSAEGAISLSPVPEGLGRRE